MGNGIEVKKSCFEKKQPSGTANSAPKGAQIYRIFDNCHSHKC